MLALSVAGFFAVWLCDSYSVAQWRNPTLTPLADHHGAVWLSIRGIDMLALPAAGFLQCGLATEPNADPTG